LLQPSEPRCLVAQFAIKNCEQIDSSFRRAPKYILTKQSDIAAVQRKNQIDFYATQLRRKECSNSCHTRDNYAGIAPRFVPIRVKFALHFRAHLNGCSTMPLKPVLGCSR
jgi:hypothetical protein